MAKNINQPVAYPIFTFRWLAIHGLAVPTVFFFRWNYSHAIHSKINKLNKLKYIIHKRIL